MNSNYTYMIGFNNKKCTGCKSCVIACSYHISRQFSAHGRGCIDVHKHNDTGRITVSYDASCCDMCPDEQVPLCMQYCPSGAVQYVRKIQKDNTTHESRDRGRK